MTICAWTTCKRLANPDNTIKVGNRKLEYCTQHYPFVKMALTKFYSTLSLPQAAQAAGHQIGSGVMRFYVGLKESQIDGSAMPAIKTKACPNPSCNAINEPEKTQCLKCGSPLSKEKFGEIFKASMAELVDLKLENFKKDLEIRLLGYKAKKLK